MYNEYINCCKTQLQLNLSDMNFKKNFHYNGVLEHVNENIGYDYLNIIKTKFKNMYNEYESLFKKICFFNDIYGKPIKCNFNNFIECSPTNLRYLLHSLLILEFIKKTNINNIDFIEIGGGYGGLCFFIYKIAHIFGIKINSYTIFDLPDIINLQERYLNALNIKNIKYYTLDNFQIINNNNFLISCYGFSELSTDIQNEYINKLINPYIKYGFISWNSIPVYKFISNSIIHVEDEYPNSGDNLNKYVRFYPK